MPSGEPPAFFKDENDSLKNDWWVSDSRFKDEADTHKNAEWVSTSLIIRQKVILKMPGGYPPVFRETITTRIKILDGYPPAYLETKTNLSKMPGVYPPAF